LPREKNSEAGVLPLSLLEAIIFFTLCSGEHIMRGTCIYFTTLGHAIARLKAGDIKRDPISNCETHLYSLSVRRSYLLVMDILANCARRSPCNYYYTLCLYPGNVYMYVSLHILAQSSRRVITAILCSDSNRGAICCCTSAQMPTRVTWSTKIRVSALSSKANGEFVITFCWLCLAKGIFHLASKENFVFRFYCCNGTSKEIFWTL
jgi:hypothetical protein